MKGHELALWICFNSFLYKVGQYNKERAKKRDMKPRLTLWESQPAKFLKPLQFQLDVFGSEKWGLSPEESSSE